MTGHSTSTKGPLLAFGMGGLNFAYYLGTVSFIQDHFDLVQSNISLSGVSCGGFAAFAIFFELSPSEAFQYLCMWDSYFSDRKLGILFVKARPSVSNLKHSDIWMYIYMM
eukprot:611546_1